MKTALISGITGQDGSYLTELLLEKGYQVHGIIRRSSSFNTKRIDHLYNHPNLKLHYGDITDGSNLLYIIQKTQPDEIYNLAAQSHVKVSFEMPEYTGQVDALGTLRILDAVRILGLEYEVRFYQASTSELYGKVQEIPQTENTPFYPRSPYGVAKIYGFWIVKNYREAYNMHASSGILFNHECFDANTPIIIKQNNIIDVCYIRNLLPERTDISKDNTVLSKEITGIEIWNGKDFVKVKAATRRKLKSLDSENQCKINYNTRSGNVKVTPNHKLMIEGFEKKEARTVKLSEQLEHGEFPKTGSVVSMTIEQAELYGMIVADGYISESGNISFSKNDSNVRVRFLELCNSVFGRFNYNESIDVKTEFGKSSYINISGVSEIAHLIRHEIYETKTKHKKVPLRILNSSYEVKKSFIDGYNNCDGLKKDKCNYTYKSFKTNSPILAQGLLLLMSEISNQKFNINVFSQNDNEYYQINFNCEETNKGIHLLKDKTELKKNSVIDEEKECFVYDIETECGYLNAGVGTLIVGNSPRRGDTFVTKKITNGLKDIRDGKLDVLSLGNLAAKRDWGHAKDYVEAMWLMLQQEQPDDYVIATGKQYSVKEFINEAAPYFNFDIIWEGEGLEEKGIDKNTGNIIIKVDPKYFRPAEVETLLGDSSKARNILGWEPKYDFKQLVKEMCENE